jgi:hypothetical protein
VKRWILTILLFLLLVSGGAIVNVVVAWGCALQPQLLFDPPAQWTNQRCEAWILAWRGREATDADLRWLGAYGWEPHPLNAWLEVTASASIVDWSGREDHVWNECVRATTDWIPPHRNRGPRLGLRVLQVRAGWPRRCLSGDRWKLEPADPQAACRYIAAIPLERFAPARLIMPLGEEPVCLLPLRPIPSGFAVNTLFYAAILWLLIGGPFVLRRLIRRQRGRCPKCGYDLRHALSGGCPECGWNRAASEPAQENAV